MQIPFFEVTEVYDFLFVSTEQWLMKLWRFKKPLNSILLLLLSLNPLIHQVNLKKHFDFTAVSPYHYLHYSIKFSN